MRLGALAELVGAVGVVASLLYVARQIRQNTNAMRATAHQEAISSLRDLNNLLLSSDLVQLFQSGIEDFDTLDEPERRQFVVLAMDMLRSFESVHNQHAMGMLDDGAWQGWLKFITDYCTAPGIQRYWRIRREAFSPGFRDLVDSLAPRTSTIRLAHFGSTGAELPGPGQSAGA